MRDFLRRVEAEHDRLTTWRKDNRSMLGTSAYRNATLAHRLLSDLLVRNGGTQTPMATRSDIRS